jgi:Cysteine-rich secretory protein family
MTHRTVKTLIAGLLLLVSAQAAFADPAELISNFRLKHGEVRVTSDATLTRIAAEQARAMAAKDNLSHEALGSFTSRIAPSRAGRAAENIAYGYDNFEKTLGQWIDSSEHRKNLLLRNATRIGVASAKDASGRRTYWAMEIAGDYEPLVAKNSKGKKGQKEQVVTVVKRQAAPTGCHVKLLGLCI